MPPYVSFVLVNIKRLLSYSTAIFIADLFVYTFFAFHSKTQHYFFYLSCYSDKYYQAKCSCTPLPHVIYFSFIYTFLAN